MIPTWLLVLLTIYLVLKILITIGELYDWIQHWLIVSGINRERKAAKEPPTLRSIK